MTHSFLIPYPYMRFFSFRWATVCVYVCRVLNMVAPSSDHCKLSNPSSFSASFSFILFLLQAQTNTHALTTMVLPVLVVCVISVPRVNLKRSLTSPASVSLTHSSPSWLNVCVHTIVCMTWRSSCGTSVTMITRCCTHLK